MPQNLDRVGDDEIAGGSHNLHLSAGHCRPNHDSDARDGEQKTHVDSLQLEVADSGINNVNRDVRNRK